MADLQARLEYIFETRGGEGVLSILKNVENAAVKSGLTIHSDLGGALDDLETKARQFSSIDFVKTSNIIKSTAVLKSLETELTTIQQLIASKAIQEGPVPDDVIKKVIRASEAVNKFNKNISKVTATMITAKGGTVSAVESTNRASDAYTRLGTSMYQATNSTTMLDRSQKTLGSTLDSAILKLIQYRLSYLLLRKAMEGLTSSVEIFAKIDSEMAQLRKVINPLNTDVELLKESAFELGREFGQSAENILKAFNIWARVGLEQNEIIEATRTTLIGVNAIGLSTVEMTEALTSAIFTYGIEVDNTVRYVNEWLRVQSKFPVSARDLANALKAVGSSAKEVGADLTELGGYVTAVNAITRKSGTAIGQSLKTIFARIQKKESIQALQEIGIAVKKSADEFRDVDDVMDELSERWDNLTGVQKTNIAQTVGGIRRYVDFLALMDAYAIKQQAIVEGTLATNEALRASNIEVDTYNKQMEQLKVAASEVGEKFGGDLAGSILGFTAVLEKVLKIVSFTEPVLGKLVKGLLTFGLTVGSIKVGVAAWHLITRLVNKALAEHVLAIDSARTTIGGYTYGVNTGTAANVGFAASLRAIRAALGPIAIIAGLVSTAFAFLPSVLNSTSISVNEFNRSATDTVKGIRDTINALEKQNAYLSKQKIEYKKLVDSYNEIKDAGGDVTNVQKKLEINGKALASVNAELSASVTILNGNLEKSDKAFESFDISINNAIERNKRLIESNRKVFDSMKQNFDADYPKTKTTLENSLEEARVLSMELNKEVSDVSKNFAKLFDNRLYDKPIFPQSYKEMFSEEQLSTMINVDMGRQILTKIMNQAEKFKKEVISQYYIKLTPAQISEIAKWKDDIENIFKEDITPEIKLKAIKGDVQSQNVILGKLEKHYSNFAGIVGSSVTKINQELDALEKQKNAFDLATIFKDDTDSQYFETSINGMEALKNKIIKVLSELQLQDSFARSIRETGQILGKGTLDIQKDLLSYYTSAVVAGRDAINDLDRQYEIAENNTTKAIQNLKDNFQNKDINVFDFTLKVKGIGASLQDIKDKLNETSKLYGNPVVSLLEEAAKKAALLGGEIVNINNLTKQELANLELQKINLENQAKIAKLIGYSEEESLQKQLEFLKVSKAVEFNTLRFLGVNEKNAKAFDSQLKYAKSIEEVLLKITYLKFSAGLEAGNKVNAFYLDLQESSYDNINDLMKTAGVNEKIILKSQRDQLKNLLNIEVANLGILEGEDKKKKAIDLYTKYLKQDFILASKLASVDYSKQLEKANEAAESFKSSMTNSFANLPELTAEGYENRKKIVDEIADAEKELAAARIDGEQKTIVELENRIRTLKKELNDIKPFLDAIVGSINQIFSDINKNIFESLAEDFAEKITKITIGDTSLGDKVGQAIANVNNENIQKLKSENDRNIENYRALLEWNIKQLGITPTYYNQSIPSNMNQEIVNFSINGLIGKIGGINKGIEEAPNKFEEALKAGGLYIASAISDAVVQSAIAGKGKNAAIGANIGQAAGFLAGSQLGAGFGPLGSLAGGLLGGLVGGLFGGDDEKEVVKAIPAALKENTRSINANTEALQNLSSTTLNAPSTFQIPLFNNSGGAPSRRISIVIYANDANDVADKVSKIINDDYNVSFNTSGVSSIYDV